MSQGFTSSQSSQSGFIPQPSRGMDAPYAAPPTSERGTGGSLFAAALMIIGGCFGALQGIAFIAKGSFYVKPANYWVSTNATTWGWWHLAIGAVVALAGVGVIFAAGWARWLGIVLVGLQALTNFVFIPVQPFWAISVILIDLWIIHSLFVYRRVEA